MMLSFLSKGRIHPQASQNMPRSARAASLSAPLHVASSLPFRSPALNTDQFASRIVTKPYFAGSLKPGDKVGDATLLSTVMTHPNHVMDTAGNTWLHFAVKAGRLEMLKDLLKWKDIDLDAMDNLKQTPYTACAVTKKPDILEIAKLLRDAGSKLQAFPPDILHNYTTHNDSIYPSDLAKVEGTEEIRQFFLKEEEKHPKRLQSQSKSLVPNWAAGRRFFFIE